MGIIRNMRSFPSTMTLNPKSPVSSHNPRRGIAQLKEQIHFGMPKGFTDSRTLWKLFHLHCHGASCTDFIWMSGCTRVDWWGHGKVHEQNSWDFPVSARTAGLYDCIRALLQEGADFCQCKETTQIQTTQCRSSVIPFPAAICVQATSLFCGIMILKIRSSG